MTTLAYGNDIRVSSSQPSRHQSPKTARNAPLAALPADARALLDRYIDDQELREGAILWEAGSPYGRVYFPVSGMISVVVDAGGGHDIEVAAIGHEGAGGMSYPLDAFTAVTSGVVRVGGRFSSVPAPAFSAVLRQSQEIRQIAAACNNWLLLQAQQMAACNAVHAADARFSRWLLRTSDATASDMIPVTQETIGQVLGIRRTTVTLLARQMQSAGRISYRRGHIHIRDRAALEAGACPCYGALGQMHWPHRLPPAGKPAEPHRQPAAAE